MRTIGFCGAGILAACVIAQPCTAPAGDVASLYQAMEIVTGTDMRERPRGFAQCLVDVLVKVSGDPRLRSDPRVVALGGNAGDYVVAFNYVDPIAGIRPKDDQGTYDRSENLTVSFDPVKIDALLVSLGAQPWRGPRPVLVPVLSVHGRKPPDYLLSATEPLASEQRNAFERIADEAGMPIRFPAVSEFQKSQQKDNTTANCNQSGLIVVHGRLEWSEAAPGWIGTWHACWHHRKHVWIAYGGGYDVAFATIVQGAMLLASGRGTPETPQRGLPRPPAWEHNR